MQKKLSIAIMVAGLALCSAVFAADKAGAAPFDVAIGKSTCDEVSKAFGVTSKTREGGMTSVAHSTPSKLYDGAQAFEVLCEKPGSPVLFASLTASKGGMGNPGARQAYAALAKYKLVKGGPIPNVGKGFAQFKDPAGNIIELNSPHMSFEFELKYMTPQVYDRLVAQAKARETAKAQQQNKL